MFDASFRKNLTRSKMVVHDRVRPFLSNVIRRANSTLPQGNPHSAYRICHFFQHASIANADQNMVPPKWLVHGKGGNHYCQPSTSG
jgi:hypothetical protein